MRILVITHSYAPKVSPRAFRWSTLCEHWVKLKGAHIDVVTSTNAGSSEMEVVNGVHVHRVGSRIDSLRASANKPSWLRTLYRQTWKRLQWPDHAALWIKPAGVKALELCQTGKYDWLISVSHPFSGHVVGLRIKEQHPELQWLADIGDPFAFMEKPAVNNRFLFKRRNFAVEGRILNRADKVSVTTESTERLYTEHFPVTTRKIVTIPPLFKLAQVETPLKRTDGAKRISFLGTLYKDIRSPEPLLKFISAFKTRYPDDPVELGAKVSELVAQARPNANMFGYDEK